MYYCVRKRIIMQSNQNTENPDVPKIPVPADVVAYVAGCSKSYVKAIRRGVANTNSKTAKTVVMAEKLFEHGTSALVQAVKEAITF